MFLKLLFLVFLSDKLCFTVSSFNINYEMFHCHKEFCNDVKCDTILDCPKDQIVPRSSYCGCCDTCIKILGQGEECKESHANDVQLEKCKAGLKCSNGICVVEDSLPDCLKLKDIRERRIEDNEGVYSEHIWIPDCDENGAFTAKQQKKKKSICVNTLGKNIFGQAFSGFAENMTCGCSRYMIELEKSNPDIFMTRPQEHCSSSGNFADLQCIDDLCYCADTVTGEVVGQIVKMKFMDKLPCYDSEIYEAGYLKPCESEMQRTGALRYSFLLKGLKVWGLERFMCDPDGTFAPVQCDSEICVCTNNDGTSIGSFKMEVDTDEELNIKQTCNCARDTKGADSNSQYPTTRCKGWGNYKLFQCFHKDQCFCVDEDGDALSIQLNKTSTDESFCSKILEDISGDSRNILPTTVVPSTPEISEDTSPDYDYD